MVGTSADPRILCIEVCNMLWQGRIITEELFSTHHWYTGNTWKHLKFISFKER